MRDIALSMTSKILTGSLLLVLCLSLSARAEYQADGDVVTDTETGLIWMQSDDNTLRTWQASLAYCQDLNLHDYTDWRLPNVNELVSLVDYGRINSAIDPAFTCNGSGYWSSSPYGGSFGVIYVAFNYGSIQKGGSTTESYVRCVRSGP